MKFNFELVDKIDLLIVDDGYSNFTPENCSFYLLKNEIYLINLIRATLYSLLKVEFSIKKIKENYFRDLIISFSPKIVLGHDMNGKIFRVKENFPNIITIAYQFGYFYEGNDKKIYRKILKNKNTDYFCVFDLRSKKFIGKIIRNTKIYITGSIKNNTNKIEMKKKMFDFLFISQFRPKSHEKKKNILISYDNHLMKKILIEMIEYCKKKKKKLAVALSSVRQDKIYYNYLNEEIQYFRNISNKIFFSKKNNSLEMANSSKVILCYNSNFGAEMMSIGKKVVFFALSKHAKFKFKRNAFNIKNLNGKKIEKIMNRILKLNQNQWHNYAKSIQLLKYDYKNKILNKLLIDIIKNEKKFV